MRSPLVPALALSLLTTTSALAGERGGSGGGRGTLGRVSSGISGASSGGSRGGGGGGGSRPPASDRDEQWVRHEDRRYDHHRPVSEDGAQLSLDARASTEEPYAVAPGPRWLGLGGIATVDFYAGDQKVQDSDGSVSVEAAVREGRLRLAGAFSHYYEQQPNGDRVTMNLPSLMAGLRIDDLGSTAVYLQGGVAHVGTDDPMGDSSLTGAIAGMHVEQRLSPRAGIVGDVQLLWLRDGVRAHAARIGVHVHHLQASFRVLDFNVGPPLYGPEVGVRF